MTATAWAYERECKGSGSPHIIISEGSNGEPVYAFVCPFCGHHRTKALGFGHELVVKKEEELKEDGEQVEYVILCCNNCLQEIRVGVDGSMSLFGGLSQAIERDMNTLIDVLGKFLPEECKEISKDNPPVKVISKVIRKYAALKRLV